MPFMYFTIIPSIIVTVSEKVHLFKLKIINDIFLKLKFNNKALRTEK